MEAVIIAAGLGSRLAGRSDLKPLTPVCGVPLIERVIRTARAAGMEAFVVVVGFRAEQLMEFLSTLAVRTGLPITCVCNPEWRGPNGLSVLTAAGHVGSPFMLMMSDHLADTELLRRLRSTTPPPDGLVLAVDMDMANPTIDLEDVTRVHADTTRIRHIGKGLETYNGFDTGFFLATSALLEALAQCRDAGETVSLSAGVQRLALRDAAGFLDVTGCFWLDVDDVRALAIAERRLASDA